MRQDEIAAETNGEEQDGFISEPVIYLEFGDGDLIVIACFEVVDSGELVELNIPEVYRRVEEPEQIRFTVLWPGRIWPGAELA